jgi:hypothetical protein
MDVSKIDERFKSGNQLPVEQVFITREEWNMIRKLIVGHEDKSGDRFKFVRIDVIAEEKCKASLSQVMP